MDQSGYSPYQSPGDMPPLQPPVPPGGGKAMASFILGLIGLVAWCCPLLGIAIGGAGLVCGFMDLSSHKRGLAIAGIVLSGLCLLASLANAAVGVYLAVTGQNPWVPQPQ